MKRVTLIAILFGLTLIFSCKQESDPYYNISSDQVGLISREVLFEKVRELYTTDSLVEDTLQLTIGAGNRKIKVYQPGGKHLLTLTPNSDSIPLVGHILVADPRFKTHEGIGLQSNFGEIKQHYSIRKIITSLNNVVVLIEDSDVYFTIDKKELPAHLRYTRTQPIELVEIPDQAKIKYLMVGWD